MADRVVRWASAVLLAAWLTSFGVLCAAVAAAEPGEGADGGGSDTSESAAGTSTGSESADSSAVKADSVDTSTRVTTPGVDDEPPEATITGRLPAATKTDSEDGIAEAVVDEAAPERDTDTSVDAVTATSTSLPDTSTAATPAVERVRVQTSPEPEHEPAPAPEPEPAPAPVAVTPIAPENPDTAPEKPDTATEEPSDLVGAVTSFVAALVNPFGSNSTPDGPAAQPQLWTAAAAARREIETAFAPPALDQPAEAATASLTYTAPPSFQDQISMGILSLFKPIAKLTGINLTAVFGGLISSAEPPGFLTWGLNASRTTFTTDEGAQWQVWEFAPPDPSGKTVIALHGGGWIYEPNILHWIDYTNMARETGATVVVPLYPLATTEAGAATTIIPATADFISQRIALDGAENVSVHADSAGASMALSAVRELILAGEPVPSSMVLLSGAMDMSTSNPDIADIDDPFFDTDNLSAWDSFWMAGLDDRDPLISPLFFEDDVMAQLPPTTIYVGDREIVYPDTLLMYERALETGAPISVVVGQGLPHDWALSGLPTYTANAAVRPDVYRQLGLIPEVATQAVQAAPTGPSLINVIGTLAWSVFDFVSAVLEGPPVVPADSGLSVGRSKLELDCGDGYSATADWYFPTTGTPDKLIYFQHGYPARAGFYNLTAAELAERNNAIVVAPSITGNLFDCYGCQLTGDQMHAAVAKLFLGDPVTGERTELTASAAAAGYTGVVPTDFVIAGHSGGGQLAAGASGYYAEYATAEQRTRLRGVLLLDTSATGGGLARALPKLDGIPVFHLAANPGPFNSYGNANAAIVAARPGQFNGFQLVNGSHSDAFRSSTLFGIAQVLVGIGTGFSTPENVDAVQVLAEGWITDWFRNDPSTPLVGIYGDPTVPGQIVAVPTDTGVDAHAYTLPGPAPQLSFFDQLIDGSLSSLQFLRFTSCAIDPRDVLSEYGGGSPEFSTRNTALSLDGRGQTGQSVGQHVCTDR